MESGGGSGGGREGGGAFSLTRPIPKYCSQSSLRASRQKKRGSSAHLEKKVDICKKKILVRRRK